MNKLIKSEITKINNILPNIIPPNFTIDDLNNLTYAAATYIQIKYSKKKNSPWKKKQLQKYRELDSQLSRIKEYKKGRPTIPTITNQQHRRNYNRNRE